MSRRAELPVKVDPRHAGADVGDYIGRVSLKLARRYPRAWLTNIADNFFHETFDFRYAQTGPSNTIDPQTIPP
jgi:hypothetical protein